MLILVHLHKYFSSIRVHKKQKNRTKNKPNGIKIEKFRLAMARYVDKEKSQNKFIIITTGSMKAILKNCLRVRNI